MSESLWRRVLFPVHRPEKLDIRRVLVVTADPWDEFFYKELRQKGEWDITIVRSVQAAIPLLIAREFPVVLCDRDLPDFDWRDVLAKVAESSPRSCFLLASSVSDEYLWREVVKLGGYDVVAKPLEEEVLTHTLHRAWYYWKSDPSLQDT